MDIEFLYYEDCPSHDQALHRLKRVMAEASIDATIKIIKVATEEQAQALHFVGSPTIRVNGEDIVPIPPDAFYSLTCRAYRLEDGRISPLPSLDMIRQPLQQAVTSE